MQLGIGDGHTTITTVLVPLLLIAAGACVGAVTLPLARTLLGRAQGVIRARRGRRTHADAGTAERRARVLMSELCPHGWHAQVTLYEGRIPGQSAEPDTLHGPVAIDWVELGPDGEQPAVMRRVWADSIGEALEAMVADRRTDETLEQIELRATADGARWPDG